jgi:putative NIF3 family GTP cyclohydrolase 1 type 2
MKLREIYELAVSMGMEADPRTKEYLKNILDKTRQKFEELKPEIRFEFDKEKLTNPYDDTRLLYEGTKKDLSRVMVGIDIEPGEVVIAKILNNIDAIISHHPLGTGLANLDGVMHLQADVLADYGVPINIAEGLLEKRIGEVARGVNAINHYQTVDAAKLLDIPIMCVHTPADNLVYQFIRIRIEKENPQTVEELIQLLKKIPEYHEATRLGFGPKIFVGSPHRRCGKIAVTEMTGGAEGAKEIYEKMATAGIGTIVGMHLSEQYKKEAEKNHINVIIAGHISSDSLGLNLFLDKIEEEGVKVVPCSGLIRVRR